jgi:hypothetical protein
MKIASKIQNSALVLGVISLPPEFPYEWFYATAKWAFSELIRLRTGFFAYCAG